MMRKIIFTDSRGRFCVLTPVISEERGMQDVPLGSTGVRFLEEGEALPDRAFRNSWKDNGTAVVPE